jgi:Xaa-Pro aminopeptidase
MLYHCAMKSDLPRLMRDRDMDALVVFGVDGLGAANTAFTYFVGDAHVSSGMAIIKRNGDTATHHLVHRNMEREEAAKTGMQLVSYEGYQMLDIIAAHNGDRRAANVELYRRLFKDLNVAGKVGFYGADSVGRSFTLLNDLARAEICEVFAEHENDVLTAARRTKDEAEVAQIRQTVAMTEATIGATRDFLKSHRVVDGALLKHDGAPLTIGDAKAFIRRTAIDQGLNYHDCIFSIGRDSAIGHSTGTPSDVIREGRTIVFDIYPPGPSGYYADITRTWCLGHAPDHVLKAYEQVMQVHAAAEQEFKLGRLTSEVNDVACTLFEAAGYSTSRVDPTSNSGYYHGLGHGFGLDVHESPYMGLRGGRPDEYFEAGTIICNEPGLYDPDDARGGWGVRVEDDYWCRPDGVFERLSSFDRTLVI